MYQLHRERKSHFTIHTRVCSCVKDAAVSVLSKCEILSDKIGPSKVSQETLEAPTMEVEEIPMLESA